MYKARENRERKIGKILLAYEIVFDALLSKEFFILLRKFAPVQIEFDYLNNQFTYYGLCNDFDIVKEGEVIPFYTVTLTDEGLKFEKVK
jgi:hypothetical protein